MKQSLVLVVLALVRAAVLVGAQETSGGLRRSTLAMGADDLCLFDPVAAPLDQDGDCSNFKGRSIDHMERKCQYSFVGMNLDPTATAYPTGLELTIHGRGFEGKNKDRLIVEVNGHEVGRMGGLTQLAGITATTPYPLTESFAYAFSSANWNLGQNNLVTVRQHGGTWYTSILGWCMGFAGVDVRFTYD